MVCVCVVCVCVCGVCVCVCVCVCVGGWVGGCHCTYISAAPQHTASTDKQNAESRKKKRHRLFAVYPGLIVSTWVSY